MVSRQQIATIVYSFYINHLNNIQKDIAALSVNAFDSSVSLHALKTNIQHARYLRVLVLRLTGMTYSQIGKYHDNATSTYMMSLAHKGYRLVRSLALFKHKRIGQALIQYTDGRVPVLVNVKDQIILDDIARHTYYSECLQDYQSMQALNGSALARTYVKQIVTDVQGTLPPHQEVSKLLSRALSSRPKTITGQVVMELITDALRLYVKSQEHAVAVEKRFPELTPKVTRRQWDNITLDEAVKFASYAATGRTNCKAWLSVNLRFADGLTVASNNGR